MTGTKGAAIDTLRAAREDFADVVKLTRELVRVPSRGGIDSYDPVLETMAAWLAGHGLACRRLADPNGTTVWTLTEFHRVERLTITLLLTPIT